MIRRRFVVWMCLGLLAACGSLVPDAPPALASHPASLVGDLKVSSSSIDFGTRKLGTSSDLSVMVTNTDVLATITISFIEVASQSEAFQLASPPAVPLVLKGGESAVLQVRFTPTVTELVTGTLKLQSDATTMSLTVSLSGAGTSDAPPFVVSPSRIDFGTQRVGTASAKSSVTVSSTSASSSLVITKVLPTHGAFSVVGPSLPFPIPSTPDGGTTETLSVSFTPTQRGRSAGDLIIEGTSGGTSSSPFTVHVALDGMGGQPVLRVEPSYLHFDVKPGTATSFPLTFTNAGNDKVTLSTLSLTGNDAASFALSSVSLPLVLQPGASARVQVTFSPSASRDHTATLEVKSDDPARPLLLLELVGYSPCSTLIFSPTVLEFGGHLVGTGSRLSNFTLSNQSPFPVTLTRLSLQGTGASQFSLVSPPQLPLTLQPDETRPVKVSFTPSVVGQADSRAVFTCEAPGSPEVGVDIHGLGLQSVLSISPSRLDFGTVDHDAEGSAWGELLLTNVSSAEVELDLPKLVSSPPNQFAFQILEDKDTLLPGESAVVSVLYYPGAISQAVGTLTFPTLVPSMPKAAVASLEGKAVSSLLDIEPANAQLDFGRVDVGTSSEPREVRITNRYSTPRQVRVESSHGDFQVSPSDVNLLIAAGETAPVRVTYRPGAAGAIKAELRLFIVGEVEPITLELKGDGRSIALQGASGCSSAGGGLAALGLWALVGWGARRRARG